jgi:hypothetical protein
LRRHRRLQEECFPSLLGFEVLLEARLLLGGRVLDAVHGRCRYRCRFQLGRRRERAVPAWLAVCELQFSVPGSVLGLRRHV